METIAFQKLNSVLLGIMRENLRADLLRRCNFPLINKSLQVLVWAWNASTRGPPSPRWYQKEHIYCGRSVPGLVNSENTGCPHLLPRAVTCTLSLQPQFRSLSPYLGLPCFHLLLRHIFFPLDESKGHLRHPYGSHWIVNLSWWIRCIKMASEEKSPYVLLKLKQLLSIFFCRHYFLQSILILSHAVSI